jgi:hypothetical protein
LIGSEKTEAIVNPKFKYEIKPPEIEKEELPPIPDKVTKEFVMALWDQPNDETDLIKEIENHWKSGIWTISRKMGPNKNKLVNAKQAKMTLKFANQRYVVWKFVTDASTSYVAYTYDFKKEKYRWWEFGENSGGTYDVECSGQLLDGNLIEWESVAAFPPFADDRKVKFRELSKNDKKAEIMVEVSKGGEIIMVFKDILTWSEDLPASKNNQ